MIAGVVEDIEQSVNPSAEKFQPSEALTRIGERVALCVTVFLI